MLRASIPSTIEIRQDITAGGVVLADPAQIHQIIMNLCTNAYQAMRESGGILAVSLKEIDILREDAGYRELAPGRYIQLEVSDTGCGIKSEIRNKIFEPHFTTKKTGEGTGLGLAVVHGIVKSYNGHIAVYGEPGRGATFHVYLPTAETQSAEAPVREELPHPNGKGERILFVDDEMEICEFASRLFAGHGYQVTALTDSACGAP